MIAIVARKARRITPEARNFRGGISARHALPQAESAHSRVGIISVAIPSTRRAADRTLIGCAVSRTWNGCPPGYTVQGEAPANRIFVVVRMESSQLVRSLLAFQGRKVPRKARLFEKLLRIIAPELTDVPIALDCCVDELAALFFHFANVDREREIAVIIEFHRATRRVGERHLSNRGD